jgi:putative intracellular protease/amidase
MDVAIPIFDRFTALDAVGPYEVLCRIPGATVHFLAAEPGPVRTETGALAISGVPLLTAC